MTHWSASVPSNLSGRATLQGPAETHCGRGLEHESAAKTGCCHDRTRGRIASARLMFLGCGPRALGWSLGCRQDCDGSE